jgi:methionyl-tRNA formyltransferase
MKGLRIGFFGDGQWACHALSKIIEDKNLETIFVYGRHDLPDPQLESLATDHGIPFFSDRNVNSDICIKKLRSKSCDLFVSMSFDQIFTSCLLATPPLGVINCHAGKLPFYRGRNILNWALINDETEFGVTVFYVDEGIDTGDIILQEVYSITDKDDYQTLLTRAFRYCGELLYRATKMIQTGSVEAHPQARIHPTGFYCSARQLGDEIINWQQSSRAIFNFVRALCTPGLHARTHHAGSEIKVERVHLCPEAPTYVGIPGAVIGVNRNSFLVKTADSFIEVVAWSGYERPRIGDRLQ